MADGTGKETIVGKTYTVDELVRTAAQDIIFYELSGVCNGRCPAVKSWFSTSAMGRGDEGSGTGIHLALMTSGAVPYDSMRRCYRIRIFSSLILNSLIR